jgi:hypothetical protein
MSRLFPSGKDICPTLRRKKHFKKSCRKRRVFNEFSHRIPLFQYGQQAGARAGLLSFAPFVSEVYPLKRLGGGPAFKDQVIFYLYGPFEFEGERKCPQVYEWLD